MSRNTNGFEYRLANLSIYKVNKTFLPEEYCHDVFKNKDCKRIKAKGNLVDQILLIGDSHAAHFTPFFEEVYKGKNVDFTSVTRNSCPPLLTLAEEELKSLRRRFNINCSEYFKEILPFIETHPTILYQPIGRSIHESFPRQ